MAVVGELGCTDRLKVKGVVTWSDNQNTEHHLRRVSQESQRRVAGHDLMVLAEVGATRRGLIMM